MNQKAAHSGNSQSTTTAMKEEVMNSITADGIVQPMSFKTGPVDRLDTNQMSCDCGGPVFYTIMVASKTLTNI